MAMRWNRQAEENLKKIKIINDAKRVSEHKI